IGVMFGNPETTSGGLALKFYSSVRLDIRKVSTVKDGEETVGSRTRVRVVKNKVAPPFKQAEFDLMYDRGISREGDLIDMAVEDKVLDKSGSGGNYGEMPFGQGPEDAKQNLRENAQLLGGNTRKVLQKRGLVVSTPTKRAAPVVNYQQEEPPAAKETGRRRQPAATTE